MKNPEKLDLNTASALHLQSIKGIGQGRAEAIVQYRDKNGPFASLDDLDLVPRVGDMPAPELEQVKQHLMIQTPEQERLNKESGKVDVNQANVAELRRVPGIGEERAEALVQYRRERGRIQDLSELDQLPYFRDQSELERRHIKESLKV